MKLPLELILNIFNQLSPELDFAITFNKRINEIIVESGNSNNEKLWAFAVKQNRLEMIKWLHENDIEGCSFKIMDTAAANGDLSIVRFLHLNRDEGCSFDAMNNAAAAGHLEVVRFLNENVTLGDKYNIRKAAERANEQHQENILAYFQSLET